MTLKRIGLFAMLIVAAVVVAVLFGLNGRQVNAEDTFSDPQAIALAEAMMDGDVAEMGRLVAAGADPNASGKDGMTLLEWEILREGYTGFLELLRLGADPTAIGWGGGTAMHLAAMYQSKLYLKALVAEGQAVDVVDGRMERSPLYSALMSNRQDNVDFLLENGASLAFTDRNGETPLHVAAAINDYHNTLRFLQLGADPLAVDRSGSTFQPGIFKSRPDLLTVTARADRDRIIAFLRARDIPLDPSAEP